MAKLSPVEMRKFEALLGMGEGYVLDFSNDSFARFVLTICGIDIFTQKYEVYGTSKAKRLRAFWEIESDPIVGKLLEDLISYYDAQVEIGAPNIPNVTDKIIKDCLNVSLRLQGKSKPEQEEKDNDFLKKEFGEIPITKLGLSEHVLPILEQRIHEIKKCLDAEASLSVVFLSGSVLEGILLDIASRNPKQFNQSKASPKNDKGTAKPFHEWSLNSLIEASYELGFLGLDIKKHGHSLRDFRNYIHPFEQMSSGFNPDKHTAEIAWKVLKAALYDISTK